MHDFVLMSGNLFSQVSFFTIPYCDEAFSICHVYNLVPNILNVEIDYTSLSASHDQCSVRIYMFAVVGWLLMVQCIVCLYVDEVNGILDLSLVGMAKWCETAEFYCSRVYL